MELKVFVKNDCPNCPPAKDLAEEIKEEEKLKVEIFNVDEAGGLAEAQFYNVLATPSLVLCDDSDEEIVSFRGDVPSKETIYQAIQS